MRVSPFRGHRFPRSIILTAVRWYCRFALSYRDVRDLLAERGVQVDVSTIYRWVQTFTTGLQELGDGRGGRRKGLG